MFERCGTLPHGFVDVVAERYENGAHKAGGSIGHPFSTVDSFLECLCVHVVENNKLFHLCYKFT